MDGAPRSIAQLADEAAATIHFSTRFSCRAWLRSCDALTDQALQERQQGNAEREFICWARIATWVPLARARFIPSKMVGLCVG